MEQTALINQKEHLKKITNKIIIILDIILIFVVIFLSLLYLALKDDNQYSQTTELKKVLPTKVAMGAFSNEEITLDIDEMQNFLMFILSQNENIPLNFKNIKIQAMNESDDVKLSIPFSYKSLNMVLTSRANVKLNTQKDKIEIKTSKLKLGKLPIPSFLASKVLKRIFQGVECKGSIIYISPSFKVNISSHELEMKFTEFKSAKGNFIIKLDGAASAVKSFVSRGLKGILNL